MFILIAWCGVIALKYFFRLLEIYGYRMKLCKSQCVYIIWSYNIFFHGGNYPCIEFWIRNTQINNNSIYSFYVINSLNLNTFQNDNCRRCVCFN